jgi:hypothetical protein
MTGRYLAARVRKNTTATIWCIEFLNRMVPEIGIEPVTREFFILFYDYPSKPIDAQLIDFHAFSFPLRSSNDRSVILMILP